jgi:hypothetical protein
VNYSGKYINHLPKHLSSLYFAELYLYFCLSYGSHNNQRLCQQTACYPEERGNIFRRTLLTLILLIWRIWRASNSIPIYIQQDATLHSLFISGNCSTCFGWYFHPSSGAHTTVSTAPGICHTVTAICRYCGRVGTDLSVLWVAYATHSTLKTVPALPRYRQIAVTV